MADEKKMTDSLSEPALINILINCFNTSLKIKSLGDWCVCVCVTKSAVN